MRKLLCTFLFFLCAGVVDAQIDSSKGDTAAKRAVLEALKKAMFSEEHLPDQALIDRFNTNESAFKRLLQMFSENSELTTVALTFTRPQDLASAHVDQKQIDDYRVIFKTLQIKNLSGSSDRKEIWFTTSFRGMGSAKGFVWLKKPPTLTAPDLDEYAAARYQRWNAAKAAHRKIDEKYAFAVYRLIRGNWYLFFSRD